MKSSFQIKKNPIFGYKPDSNVSTLVFEEKTCGENGFTLIEAIIALLILLIVVSGIFATFAYTVNYNAGNNSRSQALAVLQQEVELIRSAKFTPTKTDRTAPTGPTDGSRDISGGVKSQRIVTSADGRSFKVDVTVDDDPFTDLVQIDDSKTIKEITVKVTLNNPTPGWQTAVPATVILRRVQAN